MVSLFVNLYKLFVAVVYGVRADGEFRSLVLTLLLFLGTGTCFYWNTEGWTVLDSLYFCVMTMSTIGYGDLVPTTSVSKAFTIVFSMLSIGCFAAVVSKVVKIILVRRQDRIGHIADRT